ncbi:MAG: hypothetical protein KAT76_07750 [Bacteroidales bacterium]|nr:hypothetical protein [Bacteroidales bacterium]
MKNSNILVIIILVVYFIADVRSQELNITDPWLVINAEADDPLYTTYTAAMERSRLYGDKGYKMNYWSTEKPLSYASDKSGSMYCIWKINEVVVDKIPEYYKAPVVVASFPDMALSHYQPWPGLDVQECFMVYSSKIALVDMHITNHSAEQMNIEIYPVIEFDKDSLCLDDYDKENDALIANHYESPKRLISNLYAAGGYPKHWRDVFACNTDLYSYGAYKGPPGAFYDIIKTDFYADDRNDKLNMSDNDCVRYIALHAKLNLAPGESASVRYLRGMQSLDEDDASLVQGINEVKSMDLQAFLDQNIYLYESVPRFPAMSHEEKTMYIGAFNLARGCMLPPSGETSHNFYVFSREPLWGWGHGHQVLHESLSMLAYAFLDAGSAQGSQRVYMEQQGEDGLIAYRHGPRGRGEYPHYSRIYDDTMATTSAPFYNWINYEIYSVSKDREFLEDAYVSGKRYIEWLLENRDADDDGLLEWGPYGIIENVRDWYNAVFQVSAERYLDVDKEDISDELECLDLSLMAINEMNYLKLMAEELEIPEDVTLWEELAYSMTLKLNLKMWSQSDSFYYHINRKDDSYFFMERDLRRQEIIGFLPMWAEACDEEQAAMLVNTLCDTTKFWRKYGVPTLAADDPWFSPNVDYCCKWNGPVWLLWDYMVFRGLINYGYDELAIKLADKMILAAGTQLSKNHNYWESFSPDNDVLNCPPNYIWDAIIARVLIDKYRLLGK